MKPVVGDGCLADREEEGGELALGPPVVGELHLGEDGVMWSCNQRDTDDLLIRFILY